VYELSVHAMYITRGFRSRDIQSVREASLSLKDIQARHGVISAWDLCVCVCVCVLAQCICAMEKRTGCLIAPQLRITGPLGRTYS